MPEGRKGKIFINYRRSDDAGAAGRLYDRLEQEFARSDLFMDVDTIAAGADFVAILEQAVAACDVFLAVIGKSWLEARDASGARRLDNPNDFVRIEIASALRLSKHVIPVLVNGAQMPSADSLPEPLKPLWRRNAVRLTHERFKADAQGLVNGIKAALADAENERAARAEAERQTAAEPRTPKAEGAAKKRPLTELMSEENRNKLFAALLLSAAAAVVAGVYGAKMLLGGKAERATPLIQADQPTKEAPENPASKWFPHSKKGIYERLMPDGRTLSVAPFEPRAPASATSGSSLVQRKSVP